MPFIILFLSLISQSPWAVARTDVGCTFSTLNCTPLLGHLPPKTPQKHSKFSPDRGVAGNVARRFVEDFFAPSGAQSLISLSENLEEQGAKKYALNETLSYADSVSQSFVSALAQSTRGAYPSFFKQLDVHYTSELIHPRTWEGDLSALVALWETRNSLLFSQINFLDGAQKRATLNVGVGVRHMNDSHTLLMGTNAFFDRDFKGKNNRFSVGVEVKSSFLALSANYYRRLTDWHLSPVLTDGTFMEERPANGADLRGQMFLPFWPQLEVKGRVFRWKGAHVNLFSHNDDTQGTSNPTGYGVGIDYHPNGIFDVGFDYAHGLNNTQSTFRVIAGMRYRFDVPLKDQMRFTSPLMNAASHLYDKVDRENHIVLEKRKLINIVLKKAYVLQKSKITLPFVYTMRGYDFYDKRYVRSITWDVPRNQSFLAESSDGTSLVLHLNSPPQSGFAYDHTYHFSLTVALKNGQTLQKSSSLTIRDPFHLSVQHEYAMDFAGFGGKGDHEELVSPRISGASSSQAHLEWEFLGETRTFMKETHDSHNNAVFYVKKGQSSLPQADTAYRFKVRAVAQDGTTTPFVLSSVRLTTTALFVLRKTYALSKTHGYTMTIRGLSAHASHVPPLNAITWDVDKRIKLYFTVSADKRSIVFSYGKGAPLSQTTYSLTLSVTIAGTLHKRTATLTLNPSLEIRFPPNRTYNLDSGQVQKKWPLTMPIVGAYAAGATIYAKRGDISKRVLQFFRQETTGTHQPYFIGQKGWHYPAGRDYYFTAQAVSKDNKHKSTSYGVTVVFKEGALAFARPLVVPYATGISTTINVLNKTYQGPQVTSLQWKGLGGELGSYFSVAPDKKSAIFTVSPKTTFSSSVATFSVLATLETGQQIERRYTIRFLGAGSVFEGKALKVYARCSQNRTHFYADNKLPHTSLFTRFFGAGLTGLKTEFSLLPHEMRSSVGSVSGNHCSDTVASSMTFAHMDFPLPSLSFPTVSQMPPSVTGYVQGIRPFTDQEKNELLRARREILQRFNQKASFYKLMTRDDSLVRILQRQHRPETLAHFFWNLHHIMQSKTLIKMVGFKKSAIGIAGLGGFSLCHKEDNTCHVGIQLGRFQFRSYVWRIFMHEMVHVAGYGECVAYHVEELFMKGHLRSGRIYTCPGGASWGSKTRDYFQTP